MTDTDLTWLSTRELAARISRGELSAVEATEHHLARIEAVNPHVNAIVTTQPERALEHARRADAHTVEARRAGEALPPLHGVPMTHKDTHDTAGMRTTLGSPVFADRVPETNCLVVQRLVDAGVISTGKSNVPEFAAGAHTFNPVFGTTVNPYDTSRSAAGSSGGVGVALATGIQASGDGSDMGGSLRTPAAFNNVVGMRPSNGWIPHIPPANPWSWLSQPGFMARTVSDVALLMSVASGPHPLGPNSRPEGGGVFDLPEFARDLDPSLDGIRVALAPDLGGRLPLAAEVRDIVAGSGGVFEDLGARVGDSCPDLDDADEVFAVQRALDFVESWGDLVREEGARPDGGRIKASVVWNTEVGFGLRADEIVSAQRARARLWQRTQEFFAEHDVLVTTTAQVLPFDASLEYPDLVDGRPMENYLDWMRSVTLISATGCPAISVPGGFSANGLPVGLQIVAAPGRDVDLLRVARAFETATRHAERHPEL